MPKLSVPVNLKLIDVEDIEPPFGIDVPLPSILEVMVVSGGLLSGEYTNSKSQHSNGATSNSVQSKLLLSRFTVFEIPEYTSRV
jgi:hypothetical protein